MNKKKSKIVFTGGSGRFGNVLQKIDSNYKILFPSKKILDITNYSKSESYIKRIKPKYLIHAAAISRPMELHEKNILKSIDTNIIGTCNIVKICSKYKIKLIYFSTNYVYPKKSGSYSEKDPLLPWNAYAWSKLGGESAVQMYKGSLILRVSMTEKPFLHKKAFANMNVNFMFHEKLAEVLFKLLDLRGILNIGGKVQSVYNFAKLNNPNIIKEFVKKKNQHKFPLNSTMNISKFKEIFKGKLIR